MNKRPESIGQAHRIILQQEAEIERLTAELQADWDAYKISKDTMNEEIENLKHDLERQMDINKSLLAENETVLAENRRMLEAIQWALGERGNFPIVDGPPYYRWRGDLRNRAGLKYDPETGSVPDSSRPCPDTGKSGHNHPANPCPKCEGTGVIRD